MIENSRLHCEQSKSSFFSASAHMKVGPCYFPSGCAVYGFNVYLTLYFLLIVVLMHALRVMQ